MSILKTKLPAATLTCLCLLFSTTLTTKVKANYKPNLEFQKAKKQLPSDFYVLYRIVDRIARANEFDTRPWLIVRASRYDALAFDKSTNMIAIYDGIFEKLGSDTSALACIVSHEMAHHQQRHQAITQLEKAELIAQITEETEKEILGRRKKRSTTKRLGRFVVRNIFFKRLVGGIPGSIARGLMDNERDRIRRKRYRKAEEKINLIIEEKTYELEANIKETNKVNDIEADKMAYVASVKAGFEKEGCLRAMSVLQSTPGVQLDSNHPNITERMETINAVMKTYTFENLRKEGKNKLTQTKPLTYNFSIDQTSLRINSPNDASIGNDIDETFGS